MKLLREGPTRTGRSSASSSPSLRSASRLCAASFEKPIPGSTIGELAGHAPLGRPVERRLELGHDLAHHVPVGGGAVHLREAAAQVHEHRGDAAPGHQGRHRGIEPEGAHVVDEVGAGVERGPRHLGLRGVHRERSGAPPPQALDHRHHAPDLLVRGDRRGARPRGLAAHVHPVGALLEQPQAVRDGGLRARELPSVGEGVRGDVEDAHDQGALAEHHGGAPQRDAVEAPAPLLDRRLRSRSRTSASGPPPAAGGCRPAGRRPRLGPRGRERRAGREPWAPAFTSSGSPAMSCLSCGASSTSCSSSASAIRTRAGRFSVRSRVARSYCSVTIALDLVVDLEGGGLGVVLVPVELLAQEDGLLLLAVGEGPERLAHAPLADHLPRHLGRLLDVVLRSGRDLAEGRLLGDAAAHADRDARLELLLRPVVLLLAGQLLGEAEGHAARDDRDLVERVGVRARRAASRAWPASW